MPAALSWGGETGGQSQDGPWRGKPDLPQRPAPPRIACTAPPHQNHAAPLAVAIETSPEDVSFGWKTTLFCF